MTLPPLTLALALGATTALACPDTLLDWTRTGDPVLRDPFFLGLYEAAADGHVFTTAEGQLAMVYSGDQDDHSSIKLALGSDWQSWTTMQTLLGPEDGPNLALNKETAFYRLSATGEHQIYFIGYEDGETYNSQLFRATAPALTGPYTVPSTPFIPTGSMAGRTVEVITSPSVVEHDGLLYLSFLAWDGFEDVTTVWTLGAISHDDGATWGPVQEVDVPIGMEGQVTAMPGGGYVAVRTGGEDGAEGIHVHCADHPFGPYTTSDAPVLIQAGAPWEIDEIIAPQITFDPQSGQARLYYTGAEYVRGWWIMLAE